MTGPLPTSGLKEAQPHCSTAFDTGYVLWAWVANSPTGVSLWCTDLAASAIVCLLEPELRDPYVSSFSVGIRQRRRYHRHQRSPVSALFGIQQAQFTLGSSPVCRGGDIALCTCFFLFSRPFLLLTAFFPLRVALRLDSPHCTAGSSFVPPCGP